MTKKVDSELAKAIRSGLLEAKFLKEGMMFASDAKEFADHLENIEFDLRDLKMKGVENLTGYKKSTAARILVHLADLFLIVDEIGTATLDELKAHFPEGNNSVDVIKTLLGKTYAEARLAKGIGVRGDKGTGLKVKR